ncbi:aminopeptidase PepB [Erwinia psidii]|uniref:Aminopeptidase PepB n=1 Tax=Erwinia psidii TaxID=69224 RepID=A0A3N6SJH8_9GAMM|nr:aminopeptidase PepB [Erwinia psidii]MCX8956790.1 aminopeptidase PepB [Erwinia psidii]MCX8960398.1 aminopeptidase PepB [Erwinia psidii]MCX8964419.1 aminopeptidase PepB [Erwinia psidii]RQM40113.1 aminopeptidase PepB [Erwinia psidii]
MTTTPMKISLSTAAADPRWGDKAILTSNDSGMTIHLTGDDELTTVQRAARKINAQGVRNVSLSGDWDLEKSWAFWQGYRSPKGENQVEWAAFNEADTAEFERRLEIIDWVRDTINLPAEDLGPEQLAQRAVDLLAAVGGDKVSYRITKGDDLREQGYMGLHTVGRGSVRSPALLALDFNPDGDDTAPVFACLVGKGITFDTGGYSLKPSGSMDSMKSDMGGAATLTGALALAVSRGLKKRVKLYLCCADNMVSGNAFRLGDIIRYRNGKTVEVMNTDAEGRLVLADGLIDASEQQPQLLIDAATLTGAAKTALGNDYHALFSFDDELAQSLLSTAASENEPFWRLPLAEFHRNHLPSNFADLNNIAAPSHTAGASSAAAFLSYFVKHYQQGWLHIDCSATYRKGAVDQWAAGATGLGVRTVASMLLK